MDFSQQDLEKLRLIAESNPNLKKTLEMYEQLTTLGGPAARQQEENDRRWQIMVDAEVKMPDAEKPKTMGAFRDLLKKLGFSLVTPVRKEDESIEGHFGDFMETYGSGGMDLMSDYEMKRAAAPKPRCDEYRKESKMRCKQCGEHYCSRECRLKAWPSHKRVCSAEIVVSPRCFFICFSCLLEVATSTQTHINTSVAIYSVFIIFGLQRMPEIS